MGVPDIDDQPPPYEAATAGPNQLWSAPPGSAAARGMTRYNIYSTRSLLNWRLHEGKASAPAAYYVDWSRMYVASPKVVLRRGAKRDGPSVGFVYFAKGMTRIGLGEYRDDGVNHEVLVREQPGLFPSHYHFTGPSNGANSARCEYYWRKNEQKAREGKSIYTCLDREGNHLAGLASGGPLNIKKPGELDVGVGLRPELADMLILNALGVYFLEMGNLQSTRKAYGDDSDGSSKVS